MKRRRTTSAPGAGWIEAGPETCGFCSQAYHAVVGYYCADCDRGVCPVCIVTVHEHRSVSCPECPPPRPRRRR